MKYAVWILGASVYVSCLTIAYYVPDLEESGSECTTDTSCGCTDDCLDPLPESEDR